MVSIDQWRARIGSFRGRDAPPLDEWVCDKHCLDWGQCHCRATWKLAQWYSQIYLIAYGTCSSDCPSYCGCHNPSEQDPAKSNNHASVIENELIKGNVETHPGPKVIHNKPDSICLLLAGL